MRQSNFIVKLIGLCLALGFIFYYQTVAAQRAEAAAEHESAVAEIEEYNRRVQAENEALERAVSAEADEEPELEPGPYADGVYTGEGVGYGGTIRVSVTIADGYIDNIAVIEHSGEDPAYYMLAEAMIETMIAEQNAEVDAAAGATFSSAGLMQAVSAALEQAVE